MRLYILWVVVKQFYNFINGILVYYFTEFYHFSSRILRVIFSLSFYYWYRLTIYSTILFIEVV